MSGRKRGRLVQYVGLGLFIELLPHLAPAEWMHWFVTGGHTTLPALFIDHPSAHCRERFLEATIRSWGMLDASEAGRGDAALEPIAGSLRTALRAPLLAGLFDPAPAVRERVYSFWSDPSRLDSGLSRRVLQLLTSMFDATDIGARSWLHHAVPLILALAQKHGAENTSRTAIFAHPLERDALFHALPIGSAGSSATGAVALRPLFTLGGGLASQGDEGASDGGGMVLATQFLAPRFSATIGASGSGGAKDLRPLAASFAPQAQSFGTFIAAMEKRRHSAQVGVVARRRAAGEMGASQGRATAYQSTSFAAVASQFMKAHSVNPHGTAAAGATSRGSAGTVTQAGLGGAAAGLPAQVVAGMGKVSSSTAADAAADSAAGAGRPDAAVVQRAQAPVPVFRVSAMKSSGAGNSYGRFAQVAYSAQAKRAVRFAQQRSAAQTTVRLTRSYRSGELPDIQLSPADVIRPLQQLCELDLSIARTAFVEIFRVVYDACVATEAGGGTSRAPGSRGKASATAASAAALAAGTASLDASADELRKAARAMVMRFAASSSSSAATSTDSSVTAGSASRAARVATVSLAHELASITAEVDLAASALSRLPAAALTVPPGLVGQSALAAMSYGSAIRYIEEGLCSLRLAPPEGCEDGLKAAPLIPASAGSADTGSEITPFSLTAHRKRPPPAIAAPEGVRAAWAQLQALYAAIGEEDIVGGLLAAGGDFGGGASGGSLNRLLRDAAAAEASGPLEGAITAYSEAIAIAESGAAAAATGVSGAPAGLAALSAPAPSSTAAAAMVDDDCLLLDEDYAAAGASISQAPPPVSSALQVTTASAFTPTQQLIVGLDDRRLQCAAALQQWPRVRRLVTGLVAQQGVPLTDAGPPGNDDADEDGADEGVAAAEQSLRDLSLLEGRCGELDGRRRALVQRVCVDLSLTLLQQQQLQQQGGTGGASELKPLRDVIRRLLVETAAGARAPAAASAGVGRLRDQLQYDGAGVSFRATAQAQTYQAYGHVLRQELPRASAAIAKGIAAVPLVFTSLPALAVPARLRSLLTLQPLAELREFVGCASAASAHLLTGAGSRESRWGPFAELRALFSQWSTRSPAGLARCSIDGLSLCADVITGREVFAAGVLRGGGAFVRLAAEAGGSVSDIMKVR